MTIGLNLTTNHTNLINNTIDMFIISVKEKCLLFQILFHSFKTFMLKRAVELDILYATDTVGTIVPPPPKKETPLFILIQIIVQK